MYEIVKDLTSPDKSKAGMMGEMLSRRGLFGSTKDEYTYDIEKDGKGNITSQKIKSRKTTASSPRDENFTAQLKANIGIDFNEVVPNKVPFGIPRKFNSKTPIESSEPETNARDQAFGQLQHGFERPTSRP